ncbi:unnamed protein product [Trichogramma brassicae]|uniref:Kinesin-like protein KIF2A-like N-terminal domain-containing protein n=1 Tax=Trichogramma brassicae TaxID=86971 RepID=A0A6H5IRM7_9HYME|nr:unnamed protein product [Trichogramma brassicae]
MKGNSSDDWLIPSARPDEPTRGSSFGAQHLIPSARPDEPTRGSSSGVRHLIPSARPDEPLRGSSSGARPFTTASRDFHFFSSPSPHVTRTRNIDELGESTICLSNSLRSSKKQLKTNFLEAMIVKFTLSIFNALLESAIILFDIQSLFNTQNSEVRSEVPFTMDVNTLFYKFNTSSIMTLVPTILKLILKNVNLFLSHMRSHIRTHMRYHLLNIVREFSCEISCKFSCRVHSAIVSGVNWDQRSVTVEWFEKGETKGKENVFNMTKSKVILYSSNLIINNYGGNDDINTILNRCLFICRNGFSFFFLGKYILFICRNGFSFFFLGKYIRNCCPELVPLKLEISQKGSQRVEIDALFSLNPELNSNQLPSSNQSSSQVPSTNTKSKGVGSIPTGRIFDGVFSPGVVEPVPEVERVPLKKKTRAMSSASEAVKKPRSLCELKAKRITISRSPRRGLTRLAIDGKHNTLMMKSEEMILRSINNPKIFLTKSSIATKVSYLRTVILLSTMINIEMATIGLSSTRPVGARNMLTSKYHKGTRAIRSKGNRRVTIRSRLESRYRAAHLHSHVSDSLYTKPYVT